MKKEDKLIEELIKTCKRLGWKYGTQTIDRDFKKGKIKVTMKFHNEFDEKNDVTYD